MDGYGILINSRTTGTSRYRIAGDEAWELDTAEELAFELLNRRSNTQYVTFGNGTHEFRMWGDAATPNSNFSHDGRWAAWYVDAEINGRRWQYLPIADLDDLTDTDRLVLELVELRPVVGKIWVGASDGTEEYVMGPDDNGH